MRCRADNETRGLFSPVGPSLATSWPCESGLRDPPDAREDQACWLLLFVRQKYWRRGVVEASEVIKVPEGYKYKTSEQARAAVLKYSQSEKGVATALRRKMSGREKETKQAYQKSARGKSVRSKIVRTTQGRYVHFRGQAKRRDIPLLLTFLEYDSLVSNAVCHYCAGSLPETGCGLDRVNWKESYSLENVVPCCIVCNIRKGHLEQAGFSVARVHELLEELKSCL